MDLSTAVLQLGALAQESRLSIYRLLVESGANGLCAGDIGAQTKIAAATLSFHLKELVNSRLLTARREGRQIYYAPDFDSMNGLMNYLTENCCGGAGCGMGSNAKPRKRTEKSR